MEHIAIINQNSNIEIVNSNIISKLAEEAQDCDTSSNMTGNLQTTNAYEDDVDFLTNRFPGLSINVTQGLYISFKDKYIKQIIVNQGIGDGTGLKRSDLSSLTSVDFLKSAENRELVTSFDEFQYFTGITTIGEQLFDGYEKMKSIKLPTTITRINNKFSFLDCKELVEFDSSYCSLDNKNLGDGMFKNCLSLKSVKLGDVSQLNSRWAMFDSVNRPPFALCPSLETVDVKSIAYISSIQFPAAQNMKSVIIRSTTLPTLQDNYTISADTFGGSQVIIYVPDSALNDYKTAWTAIASNIKSISELSL